MLAFATSAVREAVNGEDVLDHVERATGVRLQVLPGTAEADLTFLAVRRWFGWSAGRLLVLDIGGGSLEVAAVWTRRPTSRSRCRWAPAASPATGWPGTRPRPRPSATCAARCASRSPRACAT